MPAREDCEVAAVVPGAGTPTVPPAYLDWSSTLQALYGGGLATPETPQPFYPPSASPSPYIWGAQGATETTRETGANLLESLKERSDDISGNADPMTGNCGDGDKATSGSVNADSTRNANPVTENCGNDDKATSGSINIDTSGSDESGGEESMKNSRDNETTPSGSSVSANRSSNQLFSAPVKMASSLPATTLNNETDTWNSSHSRAANMSGRQNTVGILSAGSTMIGLNNTAPENKMIQDEREQKRQKRKLSNRESARRSRERKQKECEEFARQVAELNHENKDLRTEIDKLNAECEKLESENASMEEELKQLYGPHALVAIDGERFPGLQCNNGHRSEVILLQ